jgi:hypothetical protein
MPYKNPEDKRRWEREHRQQRNAQRRAQRLNPLSRPVELNEPDTASNQEAKGGWSAVIGLAVGIGIAFLAALAGVSGSGEMICRSSLEKRIRLAL